MHGSKPNCTSRSVLNLNFPLMWVGSFKEIYIREGKGKVIPVL